MSNERPADEDHRGYDKPMSEYREQVFKKVYDREITTQTGLLLETSYIHIEEVEDLESTVRVDDIGRGEVHLTTEAEVSDCWFNTGTNLSPDQARELAGALYEAANVAETWGEQ